MLKALFLSSDYHLYMWHINLLYYFIVVFQDEMTFSEEEQEKLQGALQLNAQSLELVVETCEFFLHQVILLFF